MNFVKMAGTRLVPPHSLAFRPEWYPRAAHPTPRPLSLQRQNAAPRGCPPSGALQHAVSCETAPGGLPHQTHTLREVPRCANSSLLGAYRYKNRRPRPPTMWTDMSQSYLVISVGTSIIPRELNHPYSPRSRSAGMKVVQAAAQQIHTEGGSDAPHEPTLNSTTGIRMWPTHASSTPKEAVTPPRRGNKISSRKTASHGYTAAPGVTPAGLRVLHKAGIAPDSHLTQLLTPPPLPPERPSLPSSISPFPPPFSQESSWHAHSHHSISCGVRNAPCGSICKPLPPSSIPHIVLSVGFGRPPPPVFSLLP
jgi:hypothetical protein